MNRCLSMAFPSVLRAIGNGRTRPVVTAAFLMLAGSCFAATPAPTNASLDGVYVFHFSSTKEVNWFKTVTCHYATGNYTFTGGGQSANTEVIAGEATFDGRGHVVINFTDNRKFNSAASNATVSITCPSKAGEPANINDGHMVYEPATTGQYSGSYAVTSTGSATITLPDGEGGLELSLAAFNSAGLSSTFLIDTPDGSDSYLIGIGVHK